MNRRKKLYVGVGLVLMIGVIFEMVHFNSHVMNDYRDRLLRQYEIHNRHYQRVTAATIVGEDANHETDQQQDKPRPQTTTKSSSNPSPTEDNKDDDSKCPYVDSSLYRKVYIYEHPDQGPAHMRADYNSAGDTNTTKKYEEWPWLEYQRLSKEQGNAHYGLSNQVDQYALEIIVHSILANTCLRTYDPEEATLFYVPFLNSVDRWQASDRFPQGYATSKYGKAMMDMVGDQEDYQKWEDTWGITSKYWKRHRGADHISVMAEPLHGFWHPSSRRGSFHYVNSQYQLRPHIVLSVELSTSFVNMYPKCAAKNIVLPYPNPDGRNFNNNFDDEAQNVMETKDWASSPPFSYDDHHDSTTTTTTTTRRPIPMFYKGGAHGTCRQMRVAVKKDYACSSYHQLLQDYHYSVAMRLATFCPCPGGDSPSAKRMYDATLAGCIPVILSEDFVWALSTDYDDNDNDTLLDPSTFALRLDSKLYKSRHLGGGEGGDCSPTTPEEKKSNDEATLPLHARLESVPLEEIRRLQEGLRVARNRYAYFGSDHPERPAKLLQADVVPDGGASHALVRALEQRAGGVLWPACEEELKAKSKNTQQPNAFKC